MVIDEIKYTKSASSSIPKSVEAFNTAHPYDRLAALIADILFFSPILAIFLAPIRRTLLEAQLLANDGLLRSAVFNLIVTGLLVTALWITFWISNRGQTPGKIILKLKVVDSWTSKKPRPSQAFLRAVGFAFELLCLGLPWIAVSTDPQRRVLHDRISDTRVVTLTPERRAEPPHINEYAIGSAVHLLGFSLLVLIAMTFFLQPSALTESTAAHKCEPLTSALSEESTTVDAVGLGRRLDLSLALEFASQIDSTCLAQEANRAFWRNDIVLKAEESARAYLAKALAENSDEQKKKYLDKVCVTASKDDSCQIAKSESAWLAGTKKDRSHSNLQFIPKTSFGKIWLLGQLLENRNYSEIIARAGERFQVPSLMEYASGVYVQALSRSGLKDRSTELASNLFWTSSRSTKTTLARAACIESQGLFCESKAVDICQWYVNEQKDTEAKTDDFNRSLYHLAACNKSEFKTSDPIWQAVWSFKKNSNENSNENYHRLRALEAKQWPSWAGLEARRLIIDRKDISEETLQLIEKEWKALEGENDKELARLVGDDLGDMLFQKYEVLDLKTKALAIGQTILDRRSPDPKFLAQMNKLSDSENAFDIKKRIVLLLNKSSFEASERKPASVQKLSAETEAAKSSVEQPLDTQLSSESKMNSGDPRGSKP
jgi:uncharacterized RDD family membrane protein YckC